MWLAFAANVSFSPVTIVAVGQPIGREAIERERADPLPPPFPEHLPYNGRQIVRPSLVGLLTDPQRWRPPCGKLLPHRDKPLPPPQATLPKQGPTRPQVY
jgi:hypothetical protein